MKIYWCSFDEEEFSFSGGYNSPEEAAKDYRDEFGGADYENCVVYVAEPDESDNTFAAYAPDLDHLVELAEEQYADNNANEDNVFDIPEEKKEILCRKLKEFYDLFPVPTYTPLKIIGEFKCQ